MAAKQPPDDPIRTEVERRLAALADALVARPLEQVTRLVGAPCRAVHARLTQPFAVVRSVAGLAARNVEGGGARSASIETDVDDALDRSLDAPVVMADAAPERAAHDELPIDEYTSLAASQVVARLDGLSDAELERVRRFEAAHRGRRTVLGKIDQLRSDR